MMTPHKSVSLNFRQELVRSYHGSTLLSASILPPSHGPDGEAGGDLFLAGFSTTESLSNNPDVSLNAPLPPHLSSLEVQHNPLIELFPEASSYCSNLTILWF